MLPTRAHSMFSGNNNTSYRLTAYLCKNSARGGIWIALVLFFEITSFRYVPLAVVMFSLISFAEMENSITECIWFVTVRCLLFRLSLVGGTGIFPQISLFFKRQCDCICVHVCLSHHPHSSPAKEERHVFIKKKKKKKAESGKMTNLSLFVIGIY